MVDAAGVEPAVLFSGGFTVHWGYQFSYTSKTLYNWQLICITTLLIPFTRLYKSGRESVSHLGYLSNVPYLFAEDSRLPLFYTTKTFEESRSSVTFSCWQQIVMCIKFIPYWNTLLGIQPRSGGRHDAANVLQYGGSWEIRTLGTFRFAGFQDQCNRPLCQTSYWCILTVSNRGPTPCKGVALPLS